MVASPESINGDSEQTLDETLYFSIGPDAYGTDPRTIDNQVTALLNQERLNLLPRPIGPAMAVGANEHFRIDKAISSGGNSIVSAVFDRHLQRRRPLR